jgi:3D-(3,5/4)-trihydroxycyclohexane-1,2-dione acylhydrolase (decyclizing)
MTINVASFDAYKMDAEPIIADAKLTLEAMDKAAGNYKSAWNGAIKAAKDEWNAEVNRLYADEQSPLSQVRVLGDLNEKLLPKDAIVVSGSGSIPSDMQRVWRARVAGTYHMEYGFSCMGYEVAAALGAKIAQPDREVVCIVGDGAYAMLHTELLTAVQEERKIIVVVFDNAGFHCIDNLQHSQNIEHFGNEWKHRSPKDDRLSGKSVVVDYAKNGESWGAKGFTVHTAAELEVAVKAALTEEGSCVIDVKTAPKSMTHGYESWWRVGTAQVAENPAVEEAARAMATEVAKARQF